MLLPLATALRPLVPAADAHPLTTVLGGPVLHLLQDAREVLGFYRDWTAQLPDDISSQAAFLHAPDGSGTKLCAIAVCHVI